ncbi:response regulator [Gloeocapsopsis sp. IPPAS B-1203]|uniref:response regulator n=1 Tax=Gloeocapsopsis sp. IPPAS B-1203 TaxID=2049454 RepID=UPI000C184679|nr:response regulator [Gloeocapsopsis sp. IPPAS B-1203]PIG93862.1 PAS sensor protein [Gloeocapsopsis sp. IPPAS B-1203]
MSDEQFRQYVQEFHQQMAVLLDYVMQLSSPQQQQVLEVLENMSAAIANLQLLQEEMRTSLEALDVVEDQLLQQNQQVYAERKHYYNLFQFCPDAYLVTDATGLILEANSAIASLLNVPQAYLIRKPLAVFVAPSDRPAFRTFLNHLSQSNIQSWETNLCPRYGEPFLAQLKVASTRDRFGVIAALHISVHDISEYKQVNQLNEELQIVIQTPPMVVPKLLDGLQVLVVEDEADAREFISAVLESHGICVTAVASTAAALEVLEQFHPDVLVSDIRMPDEDGYSLIRKVREMEALQGWHIPAAALTAYLGEDRDKALAAGFESHLHKLAQPSELIEMVAQLAGRKF